MLLISNVRQCYKKDVRSSIQPYSSQQRCKSSQYINNTFRLLKAPLICGHINVRLMSSPSTFCGQTKMNPFECGAFNGQTTLFFYNETDPIVFIQLYRLESLEKDHQGKIRRALNLQAPGPLSNVKFKYLRSANVGDV